MDDCTTSKDQIHLRSKQDIIRFLKKRKWSKTTGKKGEGNDAGTGEQDERREIRTEERGNASETEGRKGGEDLDDRKAKGERPGLYKENKKKSVMYNQISGVTLSQTDSFRFGSFSYLSVEFCILPGPAYICHFYVPKFVLRK